MILKNIFYKFGYIEKSEFDKLEELFERYAKVCGADKEEKENAIEARDNCLKINEELANENDRLREREAELKASLCDEIQKKDLNLLSFLRKVKLLSRNRKLNQKRRQFGKTPKKTRRKT